MALAADTAGMPSLPISLTRLSVITFATSWPIFICCSASGVPFTMSTIFEPMALSGVTASGDTAKSCTTMSCGRGSPHGLDVHVLHAGPRAAGEPGQREPRQQRGERVHSW